MTQPQPAKSEPDRLRASILARILYLIDTNRDLFTAPEPPEHPAEQFEHQAALWRALRLLVVDRWPQLKEHHDG